MVVRNKKQKIPGCKPPGRDKGKNICYDNPATSVQENAKLGKCDIDCNHNDDCEVRIKESSIDFLDHTLANVSHSPADRYEMYGQRSEKESKGSRLCNDK
jgi:hypothetical protein